MGGIDVAKLDWVLRNKKALVGAVILLILALVAIFAPLIAPYGPNETRFFPAQPPSREHLLGTTSLGQDIFSQVVWGTRLTLTVGLVTGSLCALISTTIGLVAGYFGGWVDEVLSLITNVFLVLPGLPLMIIIAAYITVQSVVPIVVVISITGWAWGARVLRSQMMTLKNRDYVKAAIIAGESPLRIIFCEIFPNMLGLIVANFFGAALYAVLSEAGLEFLGLGNVNAVTWGTILYWAQNNQAMLMGQWQWMVVPGLLIAILGTSFALLNFAVDEMTNPRLRR
ncbi:MAG: ABC transporter permease [Firmicutes bacterium]|jgi:peptide/nickel transport system permease protein|nr:ABC transporter permease [Bacillota bacterium]